MSPAKQELFFAVRLRVIARFSGEFCLVIAVLNLVPLIVSLLVNDLSIAASYAVIIAILLCAGLLLGKIPAVERIQMNEAMVLAALFFLVVPLLMTIPLMVNGATFIDAFFETVSAVTTTGLSTLGAIEQRPFSLTFARAWMQWYGGLGIVILSLALVVRPGMAALRLASLDIADDLVGGARAHARRITTVYSVLTVCGLAGWLLLGGEPLSGVMYVLSAVSTGGFAPTDGSLADLPGINLAWVVTLVTLSGAVPLSLYHRAWLNHWRELLKNKELRVLLIVGLLITGLFGGMLWARGMEISEVLRHAPLMALSAQSTSGFSSLDPSSLDAGSKTVLILAMAMGGSVGSTAGGFKMLRVLILFGVLYRLLKSLSVPPDAFVEQRLGDSRIEAAEVQDALLIILLFIGVVFCSWLPFLVFGYAPLDALFEVVSATGTVGLSCGITGASLPSSLKLTLCADMLLGRLEFVAWMVFFYYRTWFGRKRGSR